MKDGNEHVHIVLALEPGQELRSPATDQLIQSAIARVGAANVHLLVATETQAATTLAKTHAVDVLVEPIARGEAPAIAYVGCHLYRTDPTAVMIWVAASRPDAADRLQANFNNLLDLVSEPGAMVSLGMGHESDAGIYGWSIYSLMESYRNYCPIDFPVLNEIAKIWDGDPDQIKRLYGKLTGAPVNRLLLSKAQKGYSTQSVIAPEGVVGVNSSSSPVANLD